MNLDRFKGGRSESCGGVPVIPQYCSQPLPVFSRAVNPEGQTEFYIGGQQVGKTGEVTYFFGQALPNVGIERDELWLGETLMFPTATHVHDILLPACMYPKANPLTKVFGNALKPRLDLLRDMDLLSVQEQAVYVGTGIEPLETSIVPRYMDLLTHVCQRMGFDPMGFDAFRCRVEYPVLHSRVSVNFPGTTAG